jgi:type IV pilus assembly protein PilC
MQKFTYKALDNGHLVKGEIEAKDIDEAESKIREKGIEILSVQDNSPKGISKTEVKNISFFKRFKKVKKIEKVFLYKNISMMLKAGLPIVEAIDLLRDSIKNRRLVEILGQLKYDIEAGSYISASLEKYPDVFGTSEIAMIRAGEAGGTLPDSFFSLFQDADSDDRFIKTIKSALTYPIIIVSILILVSLVLFLFVLPQLTGFFEQANIPIPTATKIVMAVSKFLRQYFIYLAILFIGMGIFFRMLIKRSLSAKEFFDKRLIRTPWLGKQLILFHVHRFARMLGILIKSGVPIVQALEIVEKSMTHTEYAQSIRKLKEEVKRGNKLSSAIAEFKVLYPPFVSRMLTVGDRTGNTSETLASISEYYKEELQSMLATISTLIEPILMVFMGVAVAFVAVSVLIPLYSIVSGINQMQK